MMVIETNGGVRGFEGLLCSFYFFSRSARFLEAGFDNLHAE